MSRIEKTITINAPVEQVFGYISDPANLPEIWPSMEEVQDVLWLPTGGTSFQWVYKMAGMRFEGASETTEYIPNQRIVTQSTTGIANTFTWTYQSEDGGTRVTLEVAYTVPVPLLGKLAAALIVRQNEREAETLLANLKARMEA
ncbi:MAG: SRPBCC family protein [Chloroflexi bacterium]|nr:SRPBCC family protein [Chloroflexota bacterium]